MTDKTNTIPAGKLQKSFWKDFIKFKETQPQFTSRFMCENPREGGWLTLTLKPQTKDWHIVLKAGVRGKTSVGVDLLIPNQSTLYDSLESERGSVEQSIRSKLMELVKDKTEERANNGADDSSHLPGDGFLQAMDEKLQFGWKPPDAQHTATISLSSPKDWIGTERDAAMHWLVITAIAFCEVFREKCKQQ